MNTIEIMDPKKDKKKMDEILKKAKEGDKEAQEIVKNSLNTRALYKEFIKFLADSKILDSADESELPEIEVELMYAIAGFVVAKLVPDTATLATGLIASCINELRERHETDSIEEISLEALKIAKADRGRISKDIEHFFQIVLGSKKMKICEGCGRMHP